MTEGPEFVTTRLLGGPHHGRKIQLSTAWATIQSPDERSFSCEPYDQHRVHWRGETYHLWFWAGLTAEQRNMLAGQEIAP